MKMKLRRFLSLVLVCSMVLPLCAFAPTTYATSTESEDAVIIDVTDFGADKTGVQDSAPAIVKAVAEAKKYSDGGKEVVISFPEGRYDFYPEYAFSSDLYISNTNSSYIEEFVTKKIAILIEDMKNITVDGGGSLFMLHGRMGGFFSINSENVTFKNFTLDMQVPTIIDVTIEKSAGTNSVIAYIPECYIYEVQEQEKDIIFYGDNSPYTGEPYWSLRNSTFVPRTQSRNLATGVTTRIMEKMLLTNATSVEELADNRVKITYASASDVYAPGTVIEMRRNDRDVPGAYFWDSKNVVAQNIDIGFMHGFGICAQTTENITIDDVRFKTLPGKGTFSTCTADQIHPVSCYGDIIIQNCYFENPHDDPINVHGHHMLVTEISEDRTQVRIKAMHNQNHGVANFHIGDEIEFLDANNITVLENSKRTITVIDGPNGRKGGKLGAGTDSLAETVLTLSEPIPEDVEINAFLVENVTATPNVYIRNNEFVAVPTRGILCTTKGEVVIENNIFDFTANSAIYISDDGNGWYESGRCEDVTIRNNVFRNSHTYDISFDPVVKTLPPNDNAIHKNVLIEGNTFFKSNNNARVLYATSVDGITLENNKVYRENPNVVVTATVPQNAMSVGSAQQMSVSATGTTLAGTAWKLVNSGNIVFENNIYDGGIDASIDLSGADSSDVTITNDIAKINASNKLPVAGDKYYYESSNEDVVTVSSDGVITAVGNGTAEITVYSVVAERRYESTPVVITVSDDATSFPTKIEITADRENITVGETVNFEATVVGNGDKSVTWSVYNPETLGTTTVATITSDGKLTAVAGGIVGIRAKTSNGLEARKIVVIEAEWQFTDSFEIINEIAGGYEIRGENELMIAGNNGGIWNAQLPANLIVGTFEETKGETITATVKVTGKTYYKHDQAGIVFYKDNDNYTAVHLKHGENDPTITVGNEINWTDRNNYSIKLSEIPDYNGEIYMKLEKTGDTVSGYYSLNGSDWVLIKTVTNPNLGDDYQIGLEADVNATFTPPTEYTFTEFKINGESIPLAQAATFGTITAVPEIAYANNKLSVNTDGLFSDDNTYAIVKWAMSDTVDGVYSLIDGESSSVISAISQMNGKYVKAAIIPAKSGSTVDDIVWTNAILVTGVTEEKPDGTKVDARLGSASFTGLSNPFTTFSPSVIGYFTTATVEETSVGYSFAPMASDATVQVTLNGKAVPASGTAALINSHNKFIVKVTSVGGLAVKTYSFIIRQGDVVPELPVITADAGNNPTKFTPYRANGESTVWDEITAYKLAPTNDSSETVQLDGYDMASFGNVTFPDYKYVAVTYYLDDNGSGKILEVMMQLDQLKSSSGSNVMNRVSGYQQKATAVTGKWVTQYFDFTEYATTTGNDSNTAGLPLAQCRFYPFGTLAANTITGGEVSYVQGYLFLTGAPKLYNADGSRSMINDGTQIAYVAARGYVTIDGVRYDAYTSLEDAINAISPVGGTIIVSGTTVFEDSYSGTRKHITIEGLDSKARLSNINLVVKSGDTTFDNINIAATAAEKYSHIDGGHTLTIGEGVTLDSGTNLRLGVTKENDGKIGQHVDVYAGTYTDFGAVNQYGGGLTVNGDTVYNFYGGTFSNLRGIARDGNNGTTTPNVVNGDVYYNLYGGTYSGSYLTSLSAGTLNGNLWYVVNGGTFASNDVGFAFGTASTPSSSAVTLNGSEIILINNMDLKANGGTLSGVAIGKSTGAGANAEKFKVSGYKFVIINNYELSAVTGAEISSGAVGDYQLLVCGGTAMPVFDENNNLSGFMLTPDDKDGVPYLGGEKMTVGDNGLYTIPASAGTTRTITFKSSDKQVNVMFTDGTNNTESTVNAKSTVLAPSWGYEKSGFVFAGWKIDGDDTLYLPTDIIKVGEEDMVITAEYVLQADVEIVYVKASAMFEGTGLDERSPVKSIQSAIANVGGTTSDYIIMILDSYYNSDKAAALADNVAHSGTITFSSSGDGSLGWGHSFYPGGPAIFENIKINATAENQFITADNGKLVFGENVEILNYAPKTHVGLQNKNTPYQEVELYSGSVSYLYVGAFYNTSTTTPITSDGAKVTIDGASVTSVLLGPDGYAGNNGPAEWISSPSVVLNSGKITSGITAGSNTTTVFTAPAQIVFNNGRSATINDVIPRDSRIVVRSTSDGHVDVTKTTGVFEITTDKKNIYIDGELVEKTLDNLYTIGIGDHTVTYDDKDINFVSIGGKAVAVADDYTVTVTTAGIADFTVYPSPEKENAIFLGWYVGDEAVANGAVLEANTVITAKFYENHTLEVESAEIRVSDQAFRFISKLDLDLKQAILALDGNGGSLVPEDGIEDFEGYEYGSLMIPVSLLGDKALTMDLVDSTSPATSAVKVPAKMLYEYDEAGNCIRFTVCLTNVGEDFYGEDFAVVPYLTYQDAQGIEHTVYGEQYATSMKAVAELALEDDTAGYSEEEIAVLREIIG